MPDTILPVQEPPPVAQPPPSTTAPKLDSITQDDLAREIRGDTPPPKAVFSQDGGENVRVGDDKGGVADKIMPDFGEQARNLMEKKEAEAREGKKTQTKQEAKPEAKKEEPAKKTEAKTDAPKPDDADVPEDERKVLPHDKPSTAKRINYFIRENAKLAKELEEAKKTATAAPTAANVEEVTKLKDEYGKAQDELLKFRRRYEIDNDAEFKSKYDEPVSQAETAIEATLKKYNLGEATHKAIKDAGGFAAFSRSRQVFSLPAKDEAGNDTTVQKTAAEIARSWMNGMDIADAELIRGAVGKQALLGEEKATAVKRAVDESKQFFDTRNAEQQKQLQAAQATQAEATKKYEAKLKSVLESAEWIKDREIPANATEDQKKSITEYNEFNKQLRSQIDKNPANAEEYVDLKMDAAHAHHLRREAGEKDAQIASLEAELARVRAGNRTTPKGGSLLSDKNKPAPKDDGIAPDDFRSGLRKSYAQVSGGEDE